MIKFLCNKLGRDKGLESFKAEGITPKYKLLSGNELREALKHKLIEESYEIRDADDCQEVIAELADVLEVVDGLCKAYGISAKDIEKVKEKKYQERGGFATGLYIETLEMENDNPKVQHFRASPDKYPEV
ncbi:MAG: nucleoside triphosphate pyrophosphohydrolase [Candidatus Babeliaceae bacterium]|jgi:predicted house-cleaning noncanonical NTP pyrophosphatase (MazG superfamily)